jgi:beta-lactamase class A
MFYQPARLFFFLLFVLNCPVFAVAPSVADKFYDVSYVWSKNASAVQGYREQVARILGPAVAKDLRVVADGGLHGVVYLRRGDSAGAVRVARAHSRLLRKKGLDAAAPVLSKDWSIVADDWQTEKTKSQVVLAKSAEPPVAGLSEPEPVVKKSRQVRDLEAAVEAYIKELRRKGRISKDERTGWSVYDFTTGEKLVTINEELQFQAASLIKPFIAAAFFHRVKQKELIYGPKSRRHMERMIHYSNNPSTNWVMRQVGGPRAVQRILKQNYPGIFRSTSIVEYIPAGGKTYLNKASVRDYSRFLYALWKGTIVGSREIKRLMSLPGTDRIYTGAESVPAGTRVLNKTGSTARLCADMGILSVQGPDGKRYPYTLIGIIEKQDKARNYTTWIRSRAEVIRDVSDIVYQGIARRHEFADVL